MQSQVFFWLPKIDHRPEGVRNHNTQKVNASVIQQLKSLPRKQTSLLLIAMFLSGIAYRPFQIYLSSYAKTNLTSEETVSAYSWMIIGAVGMVSGLAVGYLADKISIRRGIMFVCTLMSLSCGFLILGAERDASLFFYLSSFLFGASFYPIFGLFPAYISRCYSQKSAALAFSFGNFALGAGGVIGNFVGGVTVDMTGSFTLAYLIMLISVVFSLVVVAFFPKEDAHD
ncbi:MFS transporter [Aidingimonas halophila]|uniref:MFS transporter n=1 Tax=Aidingimonas halophila TaxID=574349 RepID=UPI000B86B0CD|nr:MFS transporter [Aidingimonas halophila]GHC23593.1 hypothetical protein GCM10008094_13020 [Aidingimonas halophila]